jgi:hypothetical protein
MSYEQIDPRSVGIAPEKLWFKKRDSELLKALKEAMPPTEKREGKGDTEEK